MVFIYLQLRQLMILPNYIIQLINNIQMKIFFMIIKILAFISYNCSTGQQYLYFFQNFFMSMQLAIIIYYFASKAFKLIENENVKVFIKGIFAVIVLYNFGILILNFVEQYVKKSGRVCKQNMWTYIRAIELLFSLVFAGVGKYVINRMEEQISRIGIQQNTAETFDTQNLPAPLLENIYQYNNKVAQKKKIWMLIIVNIISGITVNVKNFLILYNGRSDCRYISHGDDDYNNGRDVADASIVFVTKILVYYLPIVACIYVFKLKKEQKQTFEKEYFYEEGVYTTALGMKPRRANSDEWAERDYSSKLINRPKKDSEIPQTPTSQIINKSKKTSQIQSNKISSQDMHKTKSINAITPNSLDL
ncbi:transmembrane protein, putative (macronuclear) [Tetrahymena thermophila SB210]|uniref:Transmembrane protein, putative n=1 Tax=Tetrahymena thermophila (strain SB210) TaxID=312017 RepID=A4VD50_TETTS|nr:transmembrane protein, putative [Tetrahymena thermophila SB210]EDK31453.2 transmembrane protein, putative [Tetrahymena thermophila SB210]|eukprot:XP_001471441.2 transmembrane protein, putative [Tetrahymena thermophila SB210]